MKNRFVILLFALVCACACGPAFPTRLGIMGGSISTFEGIIPPDHRPCYKPEYAPGKADAYSDADDWTKTYWGHLVNDYWHCALARSTGELWTNEYLAAGTPRGFTVVEVNHGEVSWKFHPTRYQSSGFYGTHSYTAGETKYGPYLAPSYTWRDWDYVSNEARMRIGGGALTEAYQMHVYAPGAYESGYVYANIFLWDDKWETPTFSLEGGAAVPMENVDFQTEGSYDKATWEFQNYYTSIDNARRRAGSEYEVETKGLHTIFKVPCAAASGTGEVSVTDRFGNVYSRSISW